MKGLLIIKQRLSLAVLTHYITFSSDVYVFTEGSGNCYGQSRQEKDRHNDKSEYPLERNYLNAKLVNGKSYASMSDIAQQ